MAITKAQKQLREEANGMLWRSKMADARRAIEYLVLLTPTSELRNRLTSVHEELIQIEEQHNVKAS